MIKLIAALGNPGIEYKSTRHNIAWQFIKYLSFFDDLHWVGKFNGSYTSSGIGEEKFHIIMPETFMNRSGKSVRQVADFFHIFPEEILVVHDDLELEFGYAGFKNGGGLGGHNGLRSIENFFGTRDFKRFRIGISRPSHKNITSYVLGRFSKEESEKLPLILTKAADLFENNLNSVEGIIPKSISKVKLSDQ